MEEKMETFITGFFVTIIGLLVVAIFGGMFYALFQTSETVFKIFLSVIALGCAGGFMALVIKG
jgi:hypothetical protein